MRFMGFRRLPARLQMRGSDDMQMQAKGAAAMTPEDPSPHVIFAARCIINLAWALATVLIGELLDLWNL